MDIQASVAVRAACRLAGVNAHADAKWLAVWPTLSSQRPLCIESGKDGLMGGGKRREADIALHIDKLPLVPINARLHDLALPRKNIGIRLTETQQVPCGTLDIGEQHGHRALRKRSHSESPT